MNRRLRTSDSLPSISAGTTAAAHERLQPKVLSIPTARVSCSSSSRRTHGLHDHASLWANPLASASCIRVRFTTRDVDAGFEVVAVTAESGSPRARDFAPLIVNLR